MSPNRYVRPRGSDDAWEGTPPEVPIRVRVGYVNGIDWMARNSRSLEDAKLVSVNAHLAGASVIVVGRAQLFLSEGLSAEAKYVVEWKQEDGAWKWHTDIRNMNA